MKKYYIVYKTTNIINDKIYIGVHKTNDLNDDYIGSGVVLKRAIEKYGVHNFKKEFLEIFDNPEDMFALEKELVNEEFVKLENTYNIKQGGFGGFDHINSDKETQLNYVRKGVETFNKKPIEYRKKVNKLKARKGKNNGMYGIIRKGEEVPFYGHTHTKESIEKMRIAKLGKKMSDKSRRNMSISQHKRLECDKRLGVDHHNSKMWFFTKDDKKIEINNLEKYCRDHNLNAVCMGRVYSGLNKSHKGYTK